MRPSGGRWLALVLGGVVVLSTVAVVDATVASAGKDPTIADGSGGSIPSGSHLAGGSSAGASATGVASSVSSCREIDQPGTYELTANVTTDLGGSEACFTVTASNVTIDGNGRRIRSNGSGAGITVRDSTGVAVRNLTLTTLEAGMFVDGGSTVTVDDTTVRDTGDNAVIVLDSTVTIEGTTIRNVTFSGVAASNSTVTIEGTTVGDTDVNGVFFDEGSTGTIEGTTVRNVSAFGVVLREGSTGTIEGTTVRNTSFSGVIVPDSTVTVTGTVIRDTGSEGMEVRNSTATIGDTTLRNTSDDGVDALNSTVAINGSIIRDTGAFGVEFVSSAAAVDATSIRSTGGSAVVAVNSTTTIGGATIQNAGFDGVVLDESTATIDATSIRNTTFTGVRLSLGSAATIDATSIRNTGDRGVKATTSTVTIEDTTIRNTSDDGVELLAAGSATTIGDSTIRNTGDDGVALLSSPIVVIENTTVRDTVNAGVYVDSGGSITVEGSTIGNASPAVHAGEDAWTGTSTVRATDLSNTTVAVRNDNASAVLDARVNYYGSACPDPEVRGNVAYRPVMLEPPGSVNLEALQSFGSCLRMPADGSVYALGAPGPMAGNLSASTNGFDGTVYLFNATANAWEPADGDETLGPMEAAVVIPATDARAVMDFADATPARPTVRGVRAGWNFVAPRSYTGAGDGFSADTIAATDLLGPYDEPTNQPFGATGDAFAAYSFGSTPAPSVSPFTGYLVYATEDGSIPGRVPDGAVADGTLPLLTPPGSAVGDATNSASSSVTATDPSSAPAPVPAAYYGRVTENGTPVANATVTALVDGEPRANLTTDAEGRFGGSGAFEAKLRVTAERGATVRFAVNDDETNTTVTWRSGDVERVAVGGAIRVCIDRAVAGGDGAVSLAEIQAAINWWADGTAVPGTGGETIGLADIQRLINAWAEDGTVSC